MYILNKYLITKNRNGKYDLVQKVLNCKLIYLKQQYIQQPNAYFKYKMC